jgi:hypothetical protein
VTPRLWRALTGRCILVALSGITLTGLAIADEFAQPDHIRVPATMRHREALPILP